MAYAPDVVESAHAGVDMAMPFIIKPEADTEERGRLKRRRRQSSHSPPRAPSPSRGHDRGSGSRHRQHHRKHHRASSPSSSISPPTSAQKKSRRRSDAELDHTFRGRARNRSPSVRRNQNPILEDEAVVDDDDVDDDDVDEEVDGWQKFRKRSAPPSRRRIDSAEDDRELRRQRSYPNLYKVDGKDSNRKLNDGLGKMDKVSV